MGKYIHFPTLTIVEKLEIITKVHVDSCRVVYFQIIDYLQLSRYSIHDQQII